MRRAAPAAQRRLAGEPKARPGASLFCLLAQPQSGGLERPGTREKYWCIKKSAGRGIAKKNLGGGGQSSLQLGGWVGARNYKCKSTENSSPNFVVTGPRHQLISAGHHNTCITVLDGLFVLRRGPRVVQKMRSPYGQLRPRSEINRQSPRPAVLSGNGG